jgi:hypothetical protein
VSEPLFSIERVADIPAEDELSCGPHALRLRQDRSINERRMEMPRCFIEKEL